MATTDIHICNLALSRCKEKNITSMSENTKSAEVCSMWYNITRKSVLTNINASFSLKRAVLAEVADYEPVFGHKKAYILPKDCLQVIHLGNPLENNLYQIEGEYLYPAEPVDKVEIKYIADIEDVTKFDADFIELFALTLASKICEPLTHDTELAPQQDAAAEIGINAAPGMTQAAGAIKVKAAVGGFPQTCGSCQQDRVKCFTQSRQQHGSRAFTMPAQTAQIIEKCAEGQFMHTFAVKFIQQRIQFCRFQLSMCQIECLNMFKKFIIAGGDFDAVQRGIKEVFFYCFDDFFRCCLQKLSAFHAAGEFVHRSSGLQCFCQIKIVGRLQLFIHVTHYAAPLVKIPDFRTISGSVKFVAAGSFFA